MVILDMPARYPGRAGNEALNSLDSEYRTGCKDLVCKWHLNACDWDSVWERSADTLSIRKKNQQRK